jgi:hypothetical protein
MTPDEANDFIEIMSFWTKSGWKIETKNFENQHWYTATKGDRRNTVAIIYDSQYATEFFFGNKLYSAKDMLRITKLKAFL